MIILKKDNFDRETISDKVIAVNVDLLWANLIVDLLNKTYSGEESTDFFIVKPDDHKPYIYEP